MTEFILDDVNELLIKEKGDKKILEQIKRAAESGEVISIYERTYVKKLAETYLRKKLIIQEAPKTIPTPKSISPSPTPALEMKKIEPQKNFFASKTKNERTTKIAFAVGAIALAIILVIGFTQTGIPNVSPIDQVAPSSSNSELQTDLASYNLGDIISISGNSEDSLGDVTTISIENENGIKIWEEEVKLKKNGSYSTLVIAGGDGWDKDGEYLVVSKHGNKIYSTTFEFKG